MGHSRRVLVFGLIALASIAPQLEAGVSVSIFSGVWIGNGTVRPHGFDDQVAVRCKVTGELDSQHQAVFAGRCATTEGAGEFRMIIAQDAKGNTFAAKLLSGENTLDFKGKAVENTILLDQQTPSESLGRMLTSRITLETGTKGVIAFTNEVRDVESGETKRAFVVEFIRR